MKKCKSGQEMKGEILGMSPNLFFTKRSIKSCTQARSHPSKVERKLPILQRSVLYLCALVYFALFGIGCAPPASEAPVGPTLIAARPHAVAPGERVTLVGANFGLPGAQDELHFRGHLIQVLRWEERALELRIPPDTPPGYGFFVLLAGGQVSAPLSFEVLPLRAGTAGGAKATPDQGVLPSDQGFSDEG